MAYLDGQNAIELLSVAVCATITVISLLGWLYRHISHRKGCPTGPITGLAPTAAISLGIFGTFLGIYLGLRHFDTANINASIPELLEGLKTAFLTSLFGMLASLGLRYVYSVYDRFAISDNRATSEDPVVLLRHIAVNLSSLDSNVQSIGAAVVSCFKSDEEYSLLSQLKLLRTDMSDLRRDVTKSLDEFGEKVAQLGTEAMIEALRQVIEQFNSRLNDLVGEEFKQLKDAMLTLVDWQKNHREAVDSMQDQLAESLRQAQRTTEILVKAESSISKTAAHLEEVDSSVSGLSVSAADVAAHVESLRLQNQCLESLMQAVRDLGEEAKTVLPNVATHLNEASSKLVKASENAGAGFDEVSKHMLEAVEGIGNEIKKLVEEHANRVSQTSEETQKQLESALTQSLNSLAGQLASLSTKFVEDYSPLTDKLRKVVHMAEAVGRA